MARTVRFDRCGSRDVLYVADIDMPSPGPGEATVEVRAAGINPARPAAPFGRRPARAQRLNDSAKPFCANKNHDLLLSKAGNPSVIRRIECVRGSAG